MEELSSNLDKVILGNGLTAEQYFQKMLEDESPKQGIPKIMDQIISAILRII